MLITDKWVQLKSIAIGVETSRSRLSQRRCSIFSQSMPMIISELDYYNRPINDKIKVTSY